MSNPQVGHIVPVQLIGAVVRIITSVAELTTIVVRESGTIALMLRAAVTVFVTITVVIMVTDVTCVGLDVGVVRLVPAMERFIYSHVTITPHGVVVGIMDVAAIMYVVSRVVMIATIQAHMTTAAAEGTIVVVATKSIVLLIT